MRTPKRAVAERVLDHLPEVGVVDDELDDACRGQAFDVPHDQRLAARHQQRLGAGVGERAHAFAAAGGRIMAFMALRRSSRLR
jgi:hypothetical protein